jgi:predicted DNA-binding transcriptional regulator YafY
MADVSKRHSVAGKVATPKTAPVNSPTAAVAAPNAPQAMSEALEALSKAIGARSVNTICYELGCGELAMIVRCRRDGQR